MLRCGLWKRTVVENFLTDCFSSLGERSGEGQTPIKTEGGGEEKKPTKREFAMSNEKKYQRTLAISPKKKTEKIYIFFWP